MQIALLIGGTGDTWGGAYSGVRTDQPCLCLNIAEGIGPGSIGQSDGVPQAIVLIDRQHMQVSLLIDRGSNKRRRTNAGVRTDQPCLCLNVAKGVGPGPIGQSDGVPQTIVLINSQHVQVTLLIGRTSDTWGRTNTMFGACVVAG